MNVYRPLAIGWLVWCATCSATALAQRQMEQLGRGLVALHADERSVFVSWRLLGNDPEEVAFNVYRAAGGEAPVKLNAQPIRDATCFVDTEVKLDQPLAYSVGPVIGGQEQAPSRPFTLPANAPVRPYLSIPLRTPRAIRRTTHRLATLMAMASTRSFSTRRRTAETTRRRA